MIPKKYKPVPGVETEDGRKVHARPLRWNGRCVHWTALHGEAPMDRTAGGPRPRRTQSNCSSAQRRLRRLRDGGPLWGDPSEVDLELPDMAAVADAVLEASGLGKSGGGVSEAKAAFLDHCERVSVKSHPEFLEEGFDLSHLADWREHDRETGSLLRREAGTGTWP